LKLRICVVSILTALLIGILAFGSYIQGGEGAEPPATEWIQTYGGTSPDVARSVIQTSDSGYLVAGDTMSLGAGDKDFWLIKVDSSGNHEWNKTYGGANADLPFSLVATGDGGYALAGRTQSFGAGSLDFWLVKVDSSGNHEWNKTYGGASNDPAHSMVETNVVATGNGYALAGFTTSFGAGGQDGWLIKTDMDGNAEWNKTYGGANNDILNSMVATNDGGYVLAGFTTSFGAGSEDFWLIKVAGPPEYTFAIHSMPTGITFMVDSLSYSTSWTGTYEEGTSVSFEMPEVHIEGDAKYYWGQWSDGNTSRLRTITITTNITLTAYFVGPYYEISINSSPITGIPFTINGIPQSTPYAAWLIESYYTVEMPKEYDGYVWSHWLEDGDADRTKTVALPGSTWTAVYVEPPTPVGGTSISIKSEHLASWIASILLIISLVVASCIYRQRSMQ